MSGMPRPHDSTPVRRKPAELLETEFYQGKLRFSYCCLTLRLPFPANLGGVYGHPCKIVTVSVAAQAIDKGALPWEFPFSALSRRAVRGFPGFEWA
jgi:hypothetical protein